jgi:hypothetical protein
MLKKKFPSKSQSSVGVSFVILLALKPLSNFEHQKFPFPSHRCHMPEQANTTHGVHIASV